MIDHYFARVSTNVPNVTGDDTVHTIKWDQCLSSQGITYDNTSGNFTVATDGLYCMEWSFIIGNIVSNNTSGAYWVHGSGFSTLTSQEPFAWTGNPYTQANPGGCSGGGSDLMSINGAMSFKVVKNDADGGKLRIAGRVAGNTAKNITLIYDSFLSIYKLA